MRRHNKVYVTVYEGLESLDTTESSPSISNLVVHDHKIIHRVQQFHSSLSVPPMMPLSLSMRSHTCSIYACCQIQCPRAFKLASV